MTTLLLNPVDKTLVESELSDAELYRLAYLAYRITSEDLPTPGGFSRGDTSQWIDKMRFRSAPSIVVRSEAELFGINMPRFAYRAIFSENTEQASFVNLRRVDSFVSNVGRRLELGPRDEFISQLRRKCRSVADSFLAVPAWARDYHVITTDLSKWYSEEGPKQGTPFVTHFPVGGGMCAQAVCFMVSALLHQDSAGVYGVSEVTMQSTSGDDSDQRFLNFSGLTLERMKTFFGSIGLFSKSQFTSDLQDYRDALRAHLLSGIPVIVPVDMRKLRESVYTQFPFSPQDSNADAKSIQRHVVLAIGALNHDAGDCDELEFLIHDPATYPFLRASARQLFNAGASLGDKSSSPYLFPVSPGEIAPLLTVKAADPVNPKREGILWRSRKASRLKNTLKPRYAWSLVSQIVEKKCLRLFQSEWEWERLVQCLSNYTFSHSWAQVPTQFSDQAIVSIWNEGPAGGNIVQFAWNSNEQVWKPLNEAAIAFQRPKTAEALIPVGSDDPPDESGPQLKASLITSFSLSGVKEVKELLANGGIDVPIEQYVWMQRDVDEIIQAYIGNNFKSLSLRDKLSLTAVDALALLSPEKRLQKNIVNAYSKMAPSTVAIATFIPELAAHPESERAELARYAITTLGWLALGIRRRQKGDHKLSRIELVGGSRIGRVYQSMPSSGSRIELIAEVQPLAAVHLNIAENLRIAMEGDRNLLEQLKQNGIAYALEEEPGPLFALGDIRALSDFCLSFLDDPRYALIKGVVGLNADLAHWVMSGDVDDYLDSIRHRIVHAHISGHHPTSHFGDTELTSELAERYRPLLSILRQLLKEDECDLRRSKGLPQFSGYISLEYEAAPNLESIKRSLECVARIL